MLIPPAFAQTPLDSAAGPVTAAFPQILFSVGIMSLFFFTWRGQTKRQQEKQALLSALRVGDVVYTSGGIIGKISKLHDSFFEIEVAANIRLYIQKEAVINLIPTGSLKALGFK
jgi:preprotein translocase subunit YajC